MYPKLGDDVFGWLNDIADFNLLLLAAIVAAMMLATTELGFQAGQWIDGRRHPSEPARQSVTFAVGGMIGLLAFLLGISMSMAGSRYEERRQSVLNEANAIGTSWLRAQTIGGDAGQEIQRLLRDYAKLRLSAIDGANGAADTPQSLADIKAMQAELWTIASTRAQAQPTPISALMLSSLNEVFDLATTSHRDVVARVPGFILRLLVVVSLLVMGAMGYSSGLVGSRNFMLTGLLVVLWTATMVLIFDIDRPLAGNVLLDASPMVWTIEDFGAPAKPR
jgi:hypothetical protein